MPINVVCPHCESRLNLRDDLLDKQMRCPICREIFTVAAAPVTPVDPVPIAEKENPPNDKPGTSRADLPTPKYQSGSIADFLQLLPTEAVVPESDDDDEVYTDFDVVEENPRLQKKIPPKKPAIPKAVEQVPLLLEALPPPKEIVWSEKVDLFGSTPEDDAEIASPLMVPEEPEVAATEEPPQPSRDDEPEETVPPRKKRGRLAMIYFLLFVTLGAVGAGGYFLKKHIDEAPQRLYDLAHKDYKARNYEPARKHFEELAKDYPKYPMNAEARFFAELCALRVAVYSVAVKADPANAQRQLDKFLKFVDDPAMKEFVAPGRFNVDVAETALKLTEELAQKARDNFKRDKPDDAVPWLDQAEALGAIVDRYRPADGEKENVYEQMRKLRQEMADARLRLQYLAEVNERLANADDTRIDEMRKELADRGFDKDSAFAQLIDAAEKRIQERVVYKRLDPPLAPISPPRRGSTGLLFAPRLDAPNPVRQPISAGLPTVFFGLARGVLYALDETDGRVLWATRTGIDSDTLPLQVPGNDLHGERVLVVVNDGMQSSLTARLARNGDALWHQPLPAAPIGQPVLVGQRLYVPLRDKPSKAGERQRAEDVGVVLEFEIGDGFGIGRFSLGRPLGSPAVRRPGTGQLYFPAESRGVYVFDMEKQAPDGSRLDPAFRGLVPTAHAAGSLRGMPIITVGDGESSSYLILGIADGLNSMQLRAFPLASPDRDPAIVGDLPAPIPLIGWTWFPPYADAEKFAVVTDRGEFSLFGIKQTGDLDVPIFVLPTDPYLIPDARTPTRGQVVYADEGNFWFLARGALHHLRVGFDAEHGLKLVAQGKPLPLGEPLLGAQVNARADTAVVVTQATASASCRATAIDLQSGAIRWQRQLGAIVQGDPVRIGDTIILMDQDGGLYQLDVKPLAGPTQSEWIVDERWLVAPPLAQVLGSGSLLLAKDGQSVYAFQTTEGGRGPRLTIRHYIPGQPIVEKSASLPAPLAGLPAMVGKMALLPLTNGLLYRLELDPDKKLEAGPTWRGERISNKTVCHLAALNDEEFVAGDGSRTLNRWRWPTDRDEFGKRGSLSLTERIAAVPLVLRDENITRLIVADAKSNVTMWDADRVAVNGQPMRSWRPSEKGKIPIGPLTGGPFLERDATGQPRILYVIDGVNVVWLSPDTDGPLWVASKPKRTPGDGIIGTPPIRRGRLYLTDRTGLYSAIALETGEPLGEVTRLNGSGAPAATALPLNGMKLLAPLSDGTVLLLPIEGKDAFPLFLFPLPPLGSVVPVPVE